MSLQQNDTGYYHAFCKKKEKNCDLLINCSSCIWLNEGQKKSTCKGEVNRDKGQSVNFVGDGW